jgi:thioredoxin-dependent peroxiredoxin
VVVFGVSKDSEASHDEFAKKHSLPFYLAADESGAVVKAYGVGSTLGMASRVTFLVGRDNRVLKVFPSVDPAVHVDEVLAAIPK